MAIGRTAENHLLVHQGVDVVAGRLLKTHIDGVVVLAVLVGADLAPEEGRTDGESDVLRGQSVPAGLLAVDGDREFGLALVDVDFQFFNSGEIQAAQVLAHGGGCGQHVVVVFTADFNVNRWALGWPIRVFGHHDFRFGVAAQPLTYGAQHVAGRLPLALLELHEVHYDSGFVRGVPERRTLLRITGAVAHLADDRVGHVRLEFTRLWVQTLKAVLVEYFEHHAFDLARDAVGLLDVRANGLGDENIQVLRLIAGKELNLRRECAEEGKRHHHQARRSEEEKPGSAFGQSKPQEPLVASFQTWQKPVLEDPGSRA